MSLPQQTAPANLLIQMSGAPSSGKSTVARLLAPRIGGVIIDHDVLRSSLLDAAIVPFDAAAKQAYLLQWELAKDFMMNQRLSVIIDSTCNYAEVVEQGTTLANEHGYTYWYVECKVGDVDLLDKRLCARSAMTSQRSSVDCAPVAAQRTASRVGEDARAVFAKWMDSPCRPNEDLTITLDSTGSPDMLCDQILQKIS